MALMNATFFLERQRTAATFVAYTPPGFASLAFAADEVREYPKELCRYAKYQEVNEHLPNAILGSARLFAWREGAKHRTRKALFRLRIRNRALAMVMRATAPPRARRYLYRSGIYAWALRDARARARKKGHPPCGE